MSTSIAGPAHADRSIRAVRLRVAVGTDDLEQLIHAVRSSAQRYVVTEVTTRSGAAWADVVMEPTSA